MAQSIGSDFPELARIEADIAKLTQRLEWVSLALHGKIVAAPEDIVRLARYHYRIRRIRDACFEKGYFGEPSWDILLELFVARAEGKTVSVSSLCIASGVPATTALRWIGVLTADGLINRHEDQIDGRRVFVELSDAGHDRMAGLLTQMMNQTALFPRQSGEKPGPEEA